MKKLLGIAPQRNLPEISSRSFRKWLRHCRQVIPGENKLGEVYLFVDEFTDFNDAHIGIAAVKLLNRLGYRILVVDHEESGRTFLSKGLVRKAQAIARRNIKVFKDIVSEQKPLIGIEPSGILTFRDEYLTLAGPELKTAAGSLAGNCLLVEEFIQREALAGRIRKDQFTAEKLQIRLHGHCHQKALASTKATMAMLSLPVNYNVEEIPSGCCGMAGSFGYEIEHCDISMKVGELILFPSVRAASPETVISAPGTSCRQQIKDGTGRQALHPVEILYRALL